MNKIFFRYYVTRIVAYGLGGGSTGGDITYEIFSELPPSEFIQFELPKAYTDSRRHEYFFEYKLLVHVIEEYDFMQKNIFSIPLQEFNILNIY